MLFLDPQIVEKIKHYCAYQERSHSEVRYKLIELGARGEELEAIIGVLIEENFLNEERYAKAIVRGKLQYNHWGRKKIFAYLKGKQVSDYCIKKGMQEIDEVFYVELLIRLAQKKAATLQDETNIWAKQQKVIRYLLQKGFEANLIEEFVKDNIN